MNNQPILHCENLSKTYNPKNLPVEVLNNAELSIQSGEQVAIVGASGSGKSTLLHLLGGLDKPSNGSVKIKNTNIYNLSEKKRCEFRNKHLGFIYQLHHLLPEFTVLENVSMPLLIRGINVNTAKNKATDLLSKVGLDARLAHKTGELSGGERQRVAIARALVTEPSCVLADEPTGNLDPKTAERVYDVMLQAHRELNISFIIVTHDMNLANKMDRVLTIENKKLVSRTA